MKRAKGFTLVEILIVLAIIGILAAILFPVFKGVRERANQTACASNLQQIGLAVSLYRNDEKQFPSSLAFLLSNDVMLPGDGAPKANARGTGYLKSTNVLLCPDDDLDDSVRSSYGEVDISTTRPLQIVNDPYDASRFVWNFYGLDKNGWAYKTPADAAAAPLPPTTIPPTSRYVNASLAYDVKTNPIKASMSNRFTSADTIITHCIFHRTQTSNAADALNGKEPGARDIVLRIDGSAKSVEVANKVAEGSWDK